jgi:hypothetical protein
MLYYTTGVVNLILSLGFLMINAKHEKLNIFNFTSNPFKGHNRSSLELQECEAFRNLNIETSLLRINSRRGRSQIGKAIVFGTMIVGSNPTSLS